MSTADFFAIAMARDGGKTERLFRASVSAFCALTRPSRRDIAQLDDLALPLFKSASPEALRYVAAALSECHVAPHGLVSQLCDQPIDIAAPLLMRSRALSEIDLIAVIGRHGLGHARAIGRRSGLNPVISHLIRALEASAMAQAGPYSKVADTDAKKPMHVPIPFAVKLEEKVHGEVAAAVRLRLRDMMKPAGELEDSPVRPYPALRDSALTGDLGLFRRAFAQALGLDVETAKFATEGSSYVSLLAGLRALDLSEEQAFLIAAAVFPRHFAHPEAIRLFVARYRALDPDVASDRIRDWKVDMVANWISRQTKPGRGSAAESFSKRADNQADGRTLRTLRA